MIKGCFGISFFAKKGGIWKLNTNIIYRDKYLEEVMRRAHIVTLTVLEIAESPERKLTQNNVHVLWYLLFRELRHIFKIVFACFNVKKTEACFDESVNQMEELIE